MHNFLKHFSPPGMPARRAVYFADVFSWLLLNIFSRRPQKLLDRSSTFQGLVELCKGLINFAFIWQSLKGCCHCNLRKSENRCFSRKKMFFVVLPFRNGLEYRNGDWQLISALNVAISCANTVTIGGVTLEKRLLIFVLLWKKTANMGIYLAYYIRTSLTNQLW